MQAKDWIELFQRIPTDYQEGLTLIMRSGLEINLLAIFRVESSYLVCRGRKTGASDEGSAFFVPYDEINCICRQAREETINSWYGGAPQRAAEIQPVTAAAMLETAQPPEPAPVPAPQPAAGPPVKVPTPPVRPAVLPARTPPPPVPAVPQPQPMATALSSMPLPAKSAMIERLRKRAQGTGGSGVTPPKPPEQQ